MSIGICQRESDEQNEWTESRSVGDRPRVVDTTTEMTHMAGMSKRLTSKNGDDRMMIMFRMLMQWQ